MKRTMTAAEYICEIERAEENAVKMHRMNAVLAYITCAAAACYTLWVIAHPTAMLVP